MTLKHYSGSCHCKSVRYEVDLDLSKGTMRCNCSICTKSRAWFAFVNAPQFKMVSGEESLLDYQWTPPAKPAPFLTYRFCKNCGVRIYGTGDAPSMGGRMYAIAVATLDESTLMNWLLRRSSLSMVCTTSLTKRPRTRGCFRRRYLLVVRPK